MLNLVVFFFLMIGCYSLMLILLYSDMTPNQVKMEQWWADKSLSFDQEPLPPYTPKETRYCQILFW